MPSRLKPAAYSEVTIPSISRFQRLRPTLCPDWRPGLVTGGRGDMGSKKMPTFVFLLTAAYGGAGRREMDLVTHHRANCASIQ